MSRLAREITYKSLLRFAAPTILSFVFLNIYFIIDGVLVARAVGTAGLAAVNITMPVFGVMLALATMMNTGGSALIASLIGEGKLDTARKGFSFLLLSCVAGSTLLAALALLFLHPLVRFLGADAGLLLFAVSFLFVGFNIYASSFFTALNDGRTSALLSFCHTLVFMLGMLLILPRFLGVDGVWLASPAAEVLAMGMAFWMFREKGRAYGM